MDSIEREGPVSNGEVIIPEEMRVKIMVQYGEITSAKGYHIGEIEEKPEIRNPVALNVSRNYSEHISDPLREVAKLLEGIDINSATIARDFATEIDGFNENAMQLMRRPSGYKTADEYIALLERIDQFMNSIVN